MCIICDDPPGNCLRVHSMYSPGLLIWPEEEYANVDDLSDWRRIGRSSRQLPVVGKMMGLPPLSYSVAAYSDVEYGLYNYFWPFRSIYVWTCMTVISINCVCWPTDPGTNMIKHRVISGLKTGYATGWYQSHTDRRKALVSMAVSSGPILQKLFFKKIKCFIKNGIWLSYPS